MGQTDNSEFEQRVLDWLGRHWKLAATLTWLGLSVSGKGSLRTSLKKTS